MILSKHAPRVARDAGYVCVMAYAVGPLDGHRTGDRLSGSDSAVQSHPVFWALDTLTLDERAALVAERFGPAARARYLQDEAIRR